MPMVASTVSVLRQTLPLLKEAKKTDNEIRVRNRERTSHSSVAIRALRFERCDSSKSSDNAKEQGGER